MKIGIVGAGALGLSCAYDLINKGFDVTIIEKSDGFSGLLTSIKIKEEYIERYYHHIFTNDTEIIKLIKEVGLGEKLLWLEPSNSIYISDKIYPFTTPLDLLRFKEVSFIDRIKMGLLVLRAKNVKNWEELDDITAEDWIIKNTSESVYEKLWKPLLISKFDKDYENISATWIWNKFKLRGSSRESGVKTEKLGYLDGGFYLLYKKLVAILEEKGCKFAFSSGVNAIEEDENKKVLLKTDKNDYEFDKVVFSGAPNILKHVAKGFDDAYIKKLERIRYKGNICVMLETSEKISNCYWLTVADNKIPFVLVIEHTNLLKDDRYGEHITYLSRYIDVSDELFKKSDEEILEIFYAGLKKIFPNWNAKSVIKATVSRAPYTQPVVDLGYGNNLLKHETPFKNLILASMAQIYPEDRGQNYSIRMGRDIANRIIKEKT